MQGFWRKLRVGEGVSQIAFLRSVTNRLSFDGFNKSTSLVIRQ